MWYCLAVAEPAISLQSILSKAGSVRKVGDNWQAKCPAHEDNRASLSIGQGANGHILLHCHAGCSFEAIIAAWDLRAKELLPPRDTPPRKGKGVASVVYDYRNHEGKLIYQVVRMEPKDFRQRRVDPASGRLLWDMKGVTKVPYRLNELIGKETIYVVEGEKDADTLWSCKLPATTNSGGAGKWEDAYAAMLKDAGVVRAVLLPDNDAAGLRHMEHVAASLKSVDIAVNLVQLEGLMLKGDVSDWLRFHDVSELELLIARRPWVLPRSSAIGLIEPDAPLDPMLDPTRFPMTDLGNAEAFVDKEGHNLRWDVSQERWLMWDGIIWRPDRDLSIHRVANAHVRQRQVEATEYIRDKSTRATFYDYLVKLERKAGLDTLTDMTKRLLPVADSGRGWDDQPWLVACLNGVVDLRTGIINDGERGDKITMHTPLMYVPDAPCDRWQQFLLEIFDGDAELCAYTQRALGYSLTGDMREQCFFMCVGNGSNGKSTFLSTLNHVWGEYSYTTDMRTFATNSAQQDTSGFDLAELAQRRMILASETKTNSRLNEHALKNFTGGEKINAARKYGHPFEYVPTGKIWMGVNHQPRVTDDSNGFWRRVRIVPFSRAFSGSSNDPTLKDKLRAEAPGILAWAVRGCLDWRRDGLNPPNSIVSATDAYQATEDPIIDFLMERTEPDAAEWVPAAKLYKAYVEWAQDQGLNERERVTATSFGRLMQKRYTKAATNTGKRYIGLRLTARIKDELDFSR